MARSHLSSRSSETVQGASNGAISASDEKHSISGIEEVPIQQAASVHSSQIDEKDKKKKKKKKEPSVPLWRLFRFATKLDLLMILIATIFSAGIGAIQPVVIVIFGQFLGGIQDVFSDLTSGDPNVSFLSYTYDLILVFVYMGTATVVAAYCAQSFWIITGENQVRERDIS